MSFVQFGTAGSTTAERDVVERPIARALRARVVIEDQGAIEDLGSDALAAVTEDGTIDVYRLTPVADRDDERALIHSYLQNWTRMSDLTAELLE